MRNSSYFFTQKSLLKSVKVALDKHLCCDAELSSILAQHADSVLQSMSSIRDSSKYRSTWRAYKTAMKGVAHDLREKRVYIGDLCDATLKDVKPDQLTVLNNFGSEIVATFEGIGKAPKPPELPQFGVCFAEKVSVGSQTNSVKVSSVSTGTEQSCSSASMRSNHQSSTKPMPLVTGTHHGACLPNALASTHAAVNAPDLSHVPTRSKFPEIVTASVTMPKKDSRLTPVSQGSGDSNTLIDKLVLKVCKDRPNATQLQGHIALKRAHEQLAHTAAVTKKHLVAVALQKFDQMLNEECLICYKMMEEPYYCRYCFKGFCTKVFSKWFPAIASCLKLQQSFSA